MKVTPDDPRLSAYLLGELSSEEASVIKRAVAADPALRLSVDELEKSVGFLCGVFAGGGNGALLPNQREVIRRASRDADALGKVVELASAQRSWKPWLGGLSAAAAVVIAAVLMSRVEPQKSSNGMVEAGLVTDEIALLPMPGPAAGAGARSTGVASRSGSMQRQARSLENRPGEFLSEVARHLDKSPLPDRRNLPATGDQPGFTAGPQSRLPVVIGTSSLRWVSGWIREKQALPPKDAVRVEELINNAALSEEIDSAGLRVAIEAMACPWDTSALLVGVQIRAGELVQKDLELIFDSNARRRVLGSFSQQNDPDLPNVLPAKRRTLVMLELKDVQGPPGVIVVNQDSEIHSFDVPNPDQEESVGMRHAAILAGFGLWLRGEGVTAEQVRAMLVAASDDSDPVRVEVRRMISDGLKLADAER